MTASQDIVALTPLQAKINSLIQTNSSGESATSAFLQTIWPKLKADYETMLQQLIPFCNSKLQKSSLSSKVEGRVKSLSSIEKSIERREQALQRQKYENIPEIFEDLHDLVGLRIVVNNDSDVEEVTALIKATFHDKKSPNVFSSDRSVGKLWKPLFGAYKCINHHVTVRLPTADNLALYSGVVFEIQVTTVVDNLYNKFAHSLLYKKLVPTMNKRDEIFVDITHGVAALLFLCVAYRNDLMGTSNSPFPSASHEIDGQIDLQHFLKSFPNAPSALGQIVSTRGSNIIPIEEVKSAFRNPPKNCSTPDEMLKWVVEKLQPTPIGMHIVADPPKPEIDIIFIHGFNGHHTQTWTCEIKSKFDHGKAQPSHQNLGNTSSVEEKFIFWPKQLLPQTWPAARVLTYGYRMEIQHRSGLPISKPTIYDLANNFLISVESERRKKPRRPVIFIAHSLGGIIAKEMLLQSKNSNQGRSHLQQVFKSTMGILFFGTLHKEVNRRDLHFRMAELIRRVTGHTINDQIMNALLPDLDRLKTLRNDFSSLAQAHNWIVYSFQESQGSILGKKVVEDELSRMDIPIETRQHIDRDHLNMTKFSSSEDPEFKKVSSALERIEMAMATKRKVSYCRLRQK